MKWAKTEKEIARQLCQRAFNQKMKEFRAILAPKVALLENLDDVSDLFSTMRTIDKEWRFFIIGSWTEAIDNLRYLYHRNYISDEDIAPLSENKRTYITFKRPD